MDRMISRQNKRNFQTSSDKKEKPVHIQGEALKKTSISVKDFEVKKIENTNTIQERAFYIADRLNSKEIFIHGGCNCSGVRGEINFLNTNKFEWKNLKNISREFSYLYFDKKLYGHKAVSVNLQGKECLIIYGGLDGNAYNKQVFIVSKEDFEWDSANFSNCEYPLPRCFHSMNYDEESELIYIYGGWDANLINFKGENFSSLWEFRIVNSLNSLWRRIQLSFNGYPSNISLRGHTSNWIKTGKKLLVYGGVTGFNKFSDKLYSISIIDAQINQIDVKGALPRARAFHTADLIKEKSLIIYGGMIEDDAETNEIWVLDLQNLLFTEFKKEENLIIPKLFGHCSIVRENQIFILGGCKNKKYLENDTTNEENENEINEKSILENSTLMFDSHLTTVKEPNNYFSGMDLMLILNLQEI